MSVGYFPVLLLGGAHALGIGEGLPLPEEGDDGFGPLWSGLGEGAYRVDSMLWVFCSALSGCIYLLPLYVRD